MNNTPPLFDPGPAYEAYAVPCLPFDGRAWEVHGGAKVYTVVLTEYGDWSCTCPHWQYRARHTAHRHCKHTLHCKELIESSLTPRSA